MNHKPVLPLLYAAGGDFLKLLGNRMQSVSLLHTQLSCPRNDGITIGKKRCGSKRGDLINETRHDLRTERYTMQRCRLNLYICNRFTAALPTVLHAQMRSHLHEHIQNPRSCRVDTHIVQAEPTAGNNAGRSKEKCCRADISRYSDLFRRTIFRLLYRKDGYACPAALHPDTESGKHLLRMVA